MDAVGIATSALSVSDKIRALNELGMPRAEIARLLGKRYQHVRNVLEADRTARMGIERTEGVAETDRRFAPEFDPPVAVNGDLVRLDIGADGSIRLPAHILQALHLRPGGVVAAMVRDGSVEILGVEETVRRAQAWVRNMVPSDVRLSETLIADRRSEAKRD